MDILYSDRHLLHAPAYEFRGKNAGLARHPETPERVETILRALRMRGFGEPLPPEPVERPLLLQVHDSGLVGFLQQAFPRWLGRVGREIDLVPDSFSGRPSRPPPDPAYQAGYYCTDAQTPVAAGTWEAALAAASCAASGAKHLVDGRRAVFALCRPPGHHAARSSYGGYCYLNNAALAASLLREAGRVAVLDIDFHHGNGTQEVFYEDPSVLFVSVHADPETAFPYFWGYPDEKGSGKGRGRNLNLPFARDADEAEYLALLDRGLEAIRRFRGDYLVVSLGLDGYREDPLGGASLTEESYKKIGLRIRALGLPVLICLEGGYHLQTLGTCAANLAEAFRFSPALP